MSDQIAIPRPEVVARRILDNDRERGVLRKLLKLSHEMYGDPAETAQTKEASA